MSNAYTCPRHSILIEGVPCPECLALWPNLPHPLEMSGEERVAEMTLLAGITTVPFSMIHQRIEALVGRPVYTHEIGTDWEGLVAEAGNQAPPATMQEIIELIPEPKRLVVETL